jgi:hypothetical protein
MNVNLEDWIKCWNELKLRRDNSLARIVIDFQEGEFLEIQLLLNHSIGECIESQIVLMKNGKFEGLVPLARKLFELYVQLKYLAKHPEALKHYALFERLALIKNYQAHLETNEELISEGGDSIFTAEQISEIKRVIESRESIEKAFEEIGVVRKRYVTKYGDKKFSQNWYENFAELKKIKDLAFAVYESKMYKSFYSIWSASSHGEMVRTDYSVRIEGDRMISKTNEEYQNECWNLFSISFMAGIMSYYLLVAKHFRREAKREAIWLKIHTDILGMGSAFALNFEKTLGFIDQG